ncbi:acetyl/propionyl/methylcrotonyl-CoA carboxylase subunit alpha [Nocardia jiangxiensis]|uniref:acetyl/propionyl/methylcrotonyl-CoA carboxylase subunit alpha n=1 Tax=Nocardia jiangxiensis TaxID=282685 RepID=UPI0002F1B0D0|nr:acetyl/propionyl/methylcrotonyl-CoA carboxylase subunit alpha [Nocardia jiangxiensis]
MTTTTIRTVLVANRGEIAVRVMKTLRRLGIRSVAVYSDADAEALHVRYADTAVRLGPAPARESYLDIDTVIAAARRTGADAIHPGYGFLSENTAFAAACQDAGIVFIGPSARAIEVMGDKITAKTTVTESGVPVVPGIARPGLTDEDLVAAATDIGYPVLVKPSAGGGGKGMRLVTEPATLPDALISARREAAAAFGDDTLFLERFVTRPRHIEVQILADAHGTVVHLGERECSLQRRHQKVVEEAPSPLLDPATRAKIGAAACDTARSVDYRGAGTVEFIVSADRPGEFFFMEMNTRLQVEHPVTELVTGIDLVEWQVRIAAGQPLDFTQDEVTLTGHAIEARVYAEDPARGFLPTGGRVLSLDEPIGPGVRVDSSLAAGTVVGSDYDPMLSKVIAYAADRAGALQRLDSALADTRIAGVGTNIDFVRYLLTDQDVVAGRLDTALLDARAQDYHAPAPSDETLIAAAVHRWITHRASGDDPWDTHAGWRIGPDAPVRSRWSIPEGDPVEIAITGTPKKATVRIGGGTARSLHVDTTRAAVILDGRRMPYTAAEADGTIWIWLAGTMQALRHAADVALREGQDAEHTADIRSPMPGSVIAIHVAYGTPVSAGTPLVVVEAMKMEHTLTAPADGVVELFTADGDQVGVDQLLARINHTENSVDTSDVRQSSGVSR